MVIRVQAARNGRVRKCLFAIAMYTCISQGRRDDANNILPKRLQRALASHRVCSKWGSKGASMRIMIYLSISLTLSPSFAFVRIEIRSRKRSLTMRGARRPGETAAAIGTHHTTYSPGTHMRLTPFGHATESSSESVPKGQGHGNIARARAPAEDGSSPVLTCRSLAQKETCGGSARPVGLVDLH